MTPSSSAAENARACTALIKLATPAADWYAVGAILFEALTGRYPFTGSVMEILLAKQLEDAPPVSQFVPRVPPELDRLVAGLLHRIPSERPGALSLLPSGKTFISLVVRMNRDALRSPPRSVANLEFHSVKDETQEVARRLIERLNRLGYRGVCPAVGFPMEMHNFPGRTWVLSHKPIAVAAGLGRIGIHRNLIHPRFGNFVLSSQVYTNARDLARFGLLYLNRGKWKGTEIVPESWVDFVRTPAPASRRNGRNYGGQWWLVPDSRTDLPQDAYSTAGARGQFTIVVPSHDLVVVRMGHFKGATPGGASFRKSLALLMEAIPPSK